MRWFIYAALAAAGMQFSTFAEAQTFKGYPCTVDCSGHEAGYEWAEQKGITNSSSCGGNSNSFIEGCRAWAEEQETEADDVEESEEE